jgi:hypothetical protein
MWITDPSDLAALKTELLTDPKGLGLTTLVEDDAANSYKLNNNPVTPQTTMKLRVPSVSTQDLFEACDPYERQALTDQQYRDFDTVVKFGQLFPATSAKTVAMLQSLFGPNAKSTAALESLLYQDGSRAVQMFQDGLFSKQYNITPSDVANARQLP